MYLVGERKCYGGSKACPIHLLVQADVPYLSSSKTLGGPWQGPASWHTALCVILEHRAQAALPPACGGLEEVTPKMSAHKYHLNLIM